MRETAWFDRDMKVRMTGKSLCKAGFSGHDRYFDIIYGFPLILYFRYYYDRFIRVGGEETK